VGDWGRVGHGEDRGRATSCHTGSELRALANAGHAIRATERWSWRFAQRILFGLVLVFLEQSEYDANKVFLRGIHGENDEWKG